MRKRILIMMAPALLALIGAAAYGGGFRAPAAAQQAPVTVSLGPGRDGSQTGAATLTAQGSQTEVVIDIQPGPAGVAQPVHIHEGSCPGVGAVKYPLTNVVDGKSTTMVNAALSDLQKGNFSINVHKSQEQISVYVSCGPIPAAAAAAPATAAPVARTAPAAGSGGYLAEDGGGISTWWYALAAVGALMAGVGGVAALKRARSRS